jgi:hypothetical protein
MSLDKYSIFFNQFCCVMKIPFTIAILLSSLTIFGQIETLLDDVTGPSTLLVQGDTLYFSEYNGGKVSMLDLSDPDAISTTEVDDLGTPYGLAIYDHYLFVSDSQTGKLYRIDLVDENASYEEFASGLQFPTGLAIYQDQLIVADNSNFRIIKYDLTDPNTEYEVYISGLTSPTGIYVYEDDLYVADWYDNRILKYSLLNTIPDLVAVKSNLINPNHLTVWNNELYYSEFTGGTVSKIDLDLESDPEVIVTDINNPTGVAFYDNQLIFSVFGDNMIATYQNMINQTETTLSTSDITFYPNPTTGFVYNNNTLNDITVEVISSNGQLILRKEKINSQEIMDLSRYESGVYFLSIIENGLRKSIPILKL